MTHAWVPTVLATHPRKPPVFWWPHCFDCGTQVCRVGGTLYYRVTARDEWSSALPACTVLPIRSTGEDTKGTGE